jgi:hypothetical protein
LFFFKARLIKKCFVFFLLTKTRNDFVHPKMRICVRETNIFRKILSPKKGNLWYIMNQVEGKIKPFECNKIIACRESDSTKIDNKGVFLFAPRWRWRYLKIASINWIDKLQRSHCRRRHHIVSLNIPQQCRKLWEDWGLKGLMN